MAITPSTVSEKPQDYTKIYWVEAFLALMDEKTELTEDKVKFYSHVLISHTLANNILKDQKLSDPLHQDKLIENFYEEYRHNKMGERNKLLTTLFMKTLVDIDDNLLKLSADDKSYIENVALTAALRAKNFTHLWEEKDKKEWLLPYMYAKTPPKVIEYNVTMYKRLGREDYNVLVDQELYISAGVNVVPKHASDLFTAGWYTSYGKNEVSLPDVVSLRDAMQDSSKITQITNPFMGLAFFEYEILRNKLPEDVRDIYWKCKVSNISTFIEQMTKTDKLAAQK